MLARPWQRNGWGRAVVQLRSILSTQSILQGTSVGPPPLQIQEPLGQYVDVASRLLQSRVHQSPLNQALLKDSRTFAHRSHKPQSAPAYRPIWHNSSARTLTSGTVTVLVW